MAQTCEISFHWDQNLNSFLLPLQLYTYKCATVLKMLNNTGTDTFIFDTDTGTFSVPNFSDTDSETLSNSNFYWYRFRTFFPVSNFSQTNRKMKIQFFCNHYKPSKFLYFGDKNQFLHQIVPILVPRLFPVPNFSETNSETYFGTNFFRYRFRDFFGTKSVLRPVPGLFSVPIFSDTGSDTTRKKNNFPVPVPIINLQNFQILRTKISSGTKFFQYRFRDFFPVPNFSETDSETFFRYQIFSIPIPGLFFQYQIFPIPVPIP